MKPFFVPKNVKQAIEDSGRTRKWLAKQLGIKESTFRLYICGAQRPGTATAKKLAKLLDVNLNDIIINLDDIMAS